MSAQYIASWDNSGWYNIGKTGGPVYALEYCDNDNNIIVGGDFITVAPPLSSSIPANYIATYYYSGDVWSALGSDTVDGIVRCISYEYSFSKRLYFGGEFTTMVTADSGGNVVDVLYVASADVTNNYDFSAVPLGSDGKNGNGNIS